MILTNMPEEILYFIKPPTRTKEEFKDQSEPDTKPKEEEGKMAKAPKNDDQDVCALVGSSFHYDKINEAQWSFKKISDLMKTMKTGKILLFHEVEKIYGSLYDLFNQNYNLSFDKWQCRIALGETQVLAEVNKKFKAIILHSNSRAALENAEPPFLNRFEKIL